MNDKYTRNCLYCKKDYQINPHYGVNYPGKYCNRSCYFKDRKGVRVSPSTEFKKIHKTEEHACICGQEFKTNSGRTEVGRGKYCSKVCMYKYGMDKDEKHQAWKGDKVGYSALHSWVARKLGRPKRCSECGFESDNSRQFHWANISQEYKRELDDWARLCVTCHKKYDLGRMELLCVQL